MLKCALCGEDLGPHDGYVRGSISGEIMELVANGPPRPTGQKNAWEGLAFCIEHFQKIPENIADNLALTRKKREQAEHDH